MEIDTNSCNCDNIAKEIDRLTDATDGDGLKDYVLQIESAISSNALVTNGAVFYYLGTAFDTLSCWENNSQGGQESAFFVEYKKKALFYLRKSIDLLEADEKQKHLLLCTYTNYANALDSCCRVIEALRIYRKAIQLHPAFGMAWGNYGRALQFYANTVNDTGHRSELHCFAYQAIKYALDLHDPNIHETAHAYFTRILKSYNATGQKDLLEAPIVFKSYSMGSGEELMYQKWCLNNHLFLNPLNDLMEQESAFAHDPLVITRCSENGKAIPNEKSTGVEPPKYFSMLNQLKEEYVYARFLVYKGIECAKKVHYADKNVRITLSSYDYANYSIRLEQIKSAFRILFSIIDQVAFAINSYWGLGYGERQASADNIFKSKKYPKDNIALTALYWSYSEFSDNFCKAEIGAARDLKTLRNALEHKYVKIHEYPDNRKLQIEDDDFYHISEKDLYNYVLRLLKISREFIMEFVYAIGIEEDNANTDGKIILPLSVADFDDEWKV
ncbi:hypothetical protein H7271_06600 [Bittarella massiliensis]|uniref:LA2681 family HEPN domain-containing protein n=1 Tax=Bittarella massiliensis (ex Durand et al. 2017) TaxID=1720313 RepID=UPI00163C1941|nr:LA2681 family HEPN domain-containing protein [Bittarella massiliensis (ex Durand et al. 2017)]MBC2871272.1 hypothetical protein [Bittarella massiliensis (ex Durand et al. 2017)]